VGREEEKKKLGLQERESRKSTLNRGKNKKEGGLQTKERNKEKNEDLKLEGHDREVEVEVEQKRGGLKKGIKRKKGGPGA
jgi:hypothetical protein